MNKGEEQIITIDLMKIEREKKTNLIGVPQKTQHGYLTKQGKKFSFPSLQERERERERIFKTGKRKLFAYVIEWKIVFSNEAYYLPFLS